jgi:hypothetical protein
MPQTGALVCSIGKQTHDVHASYARVARRHLRLAISYGECPLADRPLPNWESQSKQDRDGIRAVTGHTVTVTGFDSRADGTVP